MKLDSFYFVTDVHGQYDLLMDRLEQVRFDWSRDILIMGGDLIDRGPDSVEVVNLLQYDNVFAVMGNHEQMLLDSDKSFHHQLHFVQNGGDWYDEDKHEQQRELIAALPHFLEVEVPYGRVGIIHAAVPYDDWRAVDDLVGDEHLWSRDKIKFGIENKVANIDLVLVGHTPVVEHVQLGNVLYCDLGASYRQVLGVVRVSDKVEIL